MFPDHYVATTCGGECPGGLKLENGLAVQTNTAIEILQTEKKNEYERFQFMFFNRKLEIGFHYGNKHSSNK